MSREVMVGDLVHLNSGSPALTVTRIVHKGTKPTGEVEVSWIADSGEPQEATFPSVCIKFIPGE